MAVGGGGVSGLFWNAPVTAGHIAIWGSPGVLEDGGAPSTGSVTSVGLSLPVSIFSVSGSPVTTTGTLTGSLQTQTANTVFAGPTSGGVATPTFRAIVTADLPDVIAAAGPIGSATVAPIITFDAKGRLTTVTSATITPAVGSITGLGTGVATALGNTAGGAGGFALFSALPTGANPTATIGTAAVNGSASTFMRSDGAPAIDQTAAFAFSGLAATAVTATPSNVTPLTISGFSAGSADTHSVLNISGTWNVGAGNNAGSAVLVNMANTSSALGSRLLDLQTSSVSVYRVLRDGSSSQAGSMNSVTVALGGSANTILSTPGAATLTFGAAPAASPVAQTIKFQDGSGTNIAAAATATILGPAGTGTGTNGDIVFKTGVKTTTGSTAATQTTALTIKGETQRVVAAKTIGTGGFTVATLPAGVQGDRTFVTDALAPTFLATLVGGGAIVSTAFFDGATWTAQ